MQAHDEESSVASATVSNLSEAVDQVKTAIWFAALGWVFMPAMCKAIRHGEVIFVIHEGQLKDVRVDLSTKTASPPKPT